MFTLPEPKPVAAGLYIVATPIGNLRDITLRALDVLSAADWVLAEDTRVAAKLMNAYGLKKKLVRYDDHVCDQVLPDVLKALGDGLVVAQISDAGTPLISDPGFRLIGAIREAGHKIVPIPGASSVLAALCLAGLPTDRFHFAGFVPNKAGARASFLESLKAIDATLILFETGPRLAESLNAQTEILGDRKACVCRELTKLYESAYVGTLSELAHRPDLQDPKGELVIIIAPPEAAQEQALTVDEALKAALLQYGPSEAAKQVAKLFNLPKGPLYQQALQLKNHD